MLSPILAAAALFAAVSNPPADPAPAEAGCAAPRGLIYVWGPDGALRISGRLGEACPEFKIRAKNLDSGEAVTVVPVVEESFEGSRTLLRFSTQVAKWKQQQAEISFEGAGP